MRIGSDFINYDKEQWFTAAIDRQIDAQAVGTSDVKHRDSWKGITSRATGKMIYGCDLCLSNIIKRAIISMKLSMIGGAICHR